MTAVLDLPALGRRAATWRQADPILLIAIGICVLLAIFAAVGPLLSPYTAEQTDILAAGQPPSAQHWFGTDALGRDIYTRVAVGARLSLVVPAIIVLLSAGMALLLALAAAWFGGAVDNAVSRFLDVLFAFPSLLFALIAVAIVGPGALAPIIALSIAYIPYMARVALVVARRERHAPYIVANSMLGMSGTRVALRHLLPSLWPVMRVQIAIAYGGALTDFAAISFLGLGVQPPTPEWGAMVSSGRTSLLEGRPEEALFAGALIVVTVVAFNLLADRLASQEGTR